MKKDHKIGFVWKITSAHMIAYFLAGIFSANIINQCQQVKLKT